MNLYQFRQPTLRLLAIALWAQAAGAAPPASAITAERILQAIGVGEGSTVCEIGAGEGGMSIAAARIVGPKGHVFASELGEARVGKLRDKVAASGAAQIVVVPSESGRTNFPDGACDGVFMRDVYHHITDPVSMNLSISAALKPGGRVAVVDFKPPSAEASVPAERSKDGRHGVTPETVSREFKDAGFEFVSSELPEQQSGRRWFMVVLSKR